MNIKKLFIIFLICFMVIPAPIMANAVPVSNVYKEGIYKLTDTDSYSATAKLITPGKFTSLIIIDPNSSVKLYKQFIDTNESFGLGPLDKNHTLVIIGNGEISIIYQRNSNMTN